MKTTVKIYDEKRKWLRDEEVDIDAAEAFAQTRDDKLRAMLDSLKSFRALDNPSAKQKLDNQRDLTRAVLALIRLNLSDDDANAD